MPITRRSTRRRRPTGEWWKGTYNSTWAYRRPEPIRPSWSASHISTTSTPRQNLPSPRSSPPRPQIQPQPLPVLEQLTPSQSTQPEYNVLTLEDQQTNSQISDLPQPQSHLTQSNSFSSPNLSHQVSFDPNNEVLSSPQRDIPVTIDLTPVTPTPQRNPILKSDKLDRSSIRTCVNALLNMPKQVRSPKYRVTSPEDSHLLLISRRYERKHKKVTLKLGNMAVAEYLRHSSVTIGEILLAPRSDTGPISLPIGNEYYVVNRGYIEYHKENMVTKLGPGDCFVVPAQQVFVLRNRSVFESELVYFSVEHQYLQQQIPYSSS